MFPFHNSHLINDRFAQLQSRSHGTKGLPAGIVAVSLSSFGTIPIHFWLLVSPPLTSREFIFPPTPAHRSV
jgi:hypothetical protein